MATEWDEVKRLAADFQRAQLSTSAQKLSDRNCIEIINKLIQSKLLVVYFTVDGKEYVTPQHLLQEIKDELYVNAGRVHLSVLAKTLNIDYAHVESKARELVASEEDVHLVLGQLIDNTYVDRLAEEINTKLIQMGQVKVGELAVQFDLPPDFLHKMLEPRLGKSVQAHADPDDRQVLMTDSFVARHRARIRGSLAATTKPTALGPILNRYSLQERLFFVLLQELISSGRLKGSVSGMKREKTAIFIPDVYAKVQNEWVDAFYSQNQYLEFDAMARLGISDPASFIRQRIPDNTPVQLQSCAVAPLILDQVEADIEEALTSGSWADVESLCPSYFNERDVKRILQLVQQRQPKRWTDTVLFERPSVIVASSKFLQAAALPFDQIMQAKAEEATLNGMAWSLEGKPVVAGSVGSAHPEAGKRGDRKEDRRKKAAGGRSGGGTQGRETRTKAVKKKYVKGRGGDSDDEQDDDYDQQSGSGAGGGRAGDLSFLSLDEIQDELTKLPAFQECPDGFAQEVARHMRASLTSKFQEVARAVYLSKSASNASLRKSHSDVQDKLNGLVTNVHFFLKGADLFADDVKLALHKYLLKTVCADTANLVLAYIAQEHMVPLENDVAFTPELRVKVTAKLPEKFRATLTKFNTSLNGKSVEDFLKNLDDVVSQGICDVIIKKVDRKKERQHLSNHRQSLLEQLLAEPGPEPALALHLVALLLFQTCTGSVLHASGKFVPQIIGLLSAQHHLTPDVQQLLQDYQVLVIKYLIQSAEPDEQLLTRQQLDQSTPQLINIARTFKKGAASSATDA